jgi:hypothetical protein
MDVARQREAPYAILAIRALSIVVLAVGALLLLAALVQRG